MKPAEYFGALKRIRDKLEARFPLGQRVQMSPEGARRFKRCADKKGTVTGHEKGVSPKIKWDHLKTPSGYHPDFLEPI